MRVCRLGVGHLSDTTGAIRRLGIKVNTAASETTADEKEKQLELMRRLEDAEKQMVGCPTNNINIHHFNLSLTYTNSISYNFANVKFA